MLTPGERPVVSAMEHKGGVWDLSVSPITALRGLRTHIDEQRGVGLNFDGPSAGNVRVRLGPGHDIGRVVGGFAEVQIVPPPVE